MKKLIKKMIGVILSPFVLKDFLHYKKLDKEKRFRNNLFDFFPCVFDKTIKTNFDAHYIYHTSWAARKVKEINPKKHTDISSSLYFSGILSAFIPVDFYDYRPAELNLSQLKSGHVDLVKLPFTDNSIYSLSCMHTIEHIGLGRYGDPIDPEGDLKAINEIKRVLAKEGSLLFVVPIGNPKIEYNAHRIYSYDQVLSYFQKLKLKEFSLITDSGKFMYNSTKEEADKQSYGCGCFWFIK
ncbi:MAG: DUF268 domain-containing protein [Minisyncoccia bacterium]